MREQSEAAWMVPIDEPRPPAYEDDRLTYMDRRPPAPLPKYYDTCHTAKSSTSNRSVYFCLIVFQLYLWNFYFDYRS